MTGLAVRDFEPADGDQVLGAMLSNAAYSNAATGYPSGPGDLQSLFYLLPDGAGSDQKRLLTIEIDDMPVGVIDAVADHPEPGSLSVGLFLVDRARQRMGIASRAAAAALRVASAAGYATIHAACPLGWESGEKFLIQLGFTPEPADEVPINRVVHANEADVEVIRWTLHVPYGVYPPADVEPTPASTT